MSSEFRNRPNRSVSVGYPKSLAYLGGVLLFMHLPRPGFNFVLQLRGGGRASTTPSSGSLAVPCARYKPGSSCEVFLLFVCTLSPPAT